MDPSGPFFRYDYQSRGEDVCQKGASSVGFFSQGGPQRSAILPRGGTEPSETGRLFFSTLQKEWCAAIYPGGDVVCIYIYIYIHIWDNSQKGGQRFSGSSWEEVWEGGGSFEKRGVDRFCKWVDKIRASSRVNWDSILCSESTLDKQRITWWCFLVEPPWRIVRLDHVHRG